jgi:hypothetical protein
MSPRAIHPRPTHPRATRRTPRAVLAALLALPVLGLAAGPVIAADPGGDEIPVTVTIPDLGDGTVALDDAVLRWSLNAETGAAAYFGGCNFLMAGVPGATGDTGGGRVWTEADGLYRAEQGDVRIERPTADGRSSRLATWGERCLAPDDVTTVSTANGLTTGAQVVLSAGTGTLDPAAGTARIEWTGTFTVVFYGGLTYWWASDPVLTVAADGTARLTATAGGYGTSMQDMSQWVPIPATEIVLADLTGVAVTAADGVVARPRYAGVRVQVPAGSSPQVLDGASAGSFPQSFVTFQGLTGQAAYWYSSGGLADSRKVASDLAVSWSAASQVRPSTPTTRTAATGGAVLASAGGGGSGARGTGTGGGTLPAGSAVLAALPTVPTAQVRTVGLAGADLVPGVGAGTSADERVAWGTSGLLLAATGAVIGFRRGWLVLPWR